MRCCAIYRFMKNPNATSFGKLSKGTSSVLPMHDETRPFVRATALRSRNSVDSTLNQIAIPMEYEPRRIGLSVANGDVRQRDYSTKRLPNNDSTGFDTYNSRFTQRKRDERLADDPYSAPRTDQRQPYFPSNPGADV
ncbi:hypothetical protein AB6A40_008983 [Gnathostoma spinigerum]|uniref:Uncharacterized protein n=1 Tax=Gnathostoma spinigerum TaxID=75299 RepID=A0ABD6EQM2_9BILA